MLYCFVESFFTQKEIAMPVALIGNNWGGRMQGDLLAYYDEMSRTCDIIGGQEVNHCPHAGSAEIVNAINKRDTEKGLHDQIMVNQFEMLKAETYWTHDAHFAAENTATYECASGTTFPGTQYGNALFVSHRLRIIKVDEVFILGGHSKKLENGSSSRIMQYVIFEIGGVRYLVAHYHGVWYQDKITMSTKSDGPIRIRQSANISSALELLAAEYAVTKTVFGGDLNLDMDTQAIAMLEKGTIAGNMPMRNLVRERGITDTRVAGKYRDYHTPGTSLYADYMFVSEDVQVNSLQLVGAHVSDHMHLLLDFQ